MVSVWALVVNAVVGLVILLVVNAIGLAVQVSILTLLICAVLGVPGALLVILLSVVDIAFTATVVPLVV